MFYVRSELLVVLALAGCQLGCGSSQTPLAKAPPENTADESETPQASGPAVTADDNSNDVVPPDSEDPTVTPPEEEPDVAEAVDPNTSTDDTSAAAQEQLETEESTTDVSSGILKRLLLFTKGGPLVVDIGLTIDGQTTPRATDEWIGELLAAADTDGDGEPTWNEAVDSPRLAFDEFAGGNSGDRQERIRLYDRDRDGVVDRSEMWSLVSHGDAAGLAFRLNRAGAMGNMASPLADVKHFLDLDVNGQLSAKEIEAAPGQLKLADIDDDDMIQAQELQRADVMAQQNDMGSNRASRPLPAVLLDQQTSWGVVYYELKERYHYGGPFDASNFPLIPGLVEALDENGDQELNRDEVEGLAVIEPHILLAVQFGVAEDDNAARLQILRVTPQLGLAEQDVIQTQAGERIELAGMTLGFSAYDTSGTGSYAAAAREEFDKFDADKNGYLEQQELKEERADEFSFWDADGDGRVFLEELTDAFRSQQSPLLNRIEADVAESRQSLFTALDVSRDARLSSREIQQAAERFRQLDQNGDGRLVQREMPGRIAVVLRRGQASAPQAAGAAAVSAETDQPAGPAWFIGMDSNGDGDVSRREFLGPLASFTLLDADGDGLLSPSESGDEEADGDAMSEDETADDTAPSDEPAPVAESADSTS